MLVHLLQYCLKLENVKWKRADSKPTPKVNGNNLPVERIDLTNLNSNLS